MLTKTLAALALALLVAAVWVAPICAAFTLPGHLIVTAVIAAALAGARWLDG